MAHRISINNNGQEFFFRGSFSYSISSSLLFFLAPVCCLRRRRRVSWTRNLLHFHLAPPEAHQFRRFSSPRKTKFPASSWTDIHLLRAEPEGGKKIFSYLIKLNYRVAACCAIQALFDLFFILSPFSASSCVLLCFSSHVI